MAVQLAPEEPEAGPWHAELLTVIIAALTRRGSGRAVGARSVVLAVDGRSSSGKTTLAARVQAAVAGSAVVHTDDIAWWHSRFGWADLLIGGILVPVHRGEPVSFRPPRWAEYGRGGSIDVPADCPFAHHRGGWCRAPRSRAPGRCAGLGAIRSAGSRASEPRTGRATGRTADRAGVA